MMMNDEKSWRIKSAEAMGYGTAILGAAGSGKTNLAIRLIDAFRGTGARVLMLDPKNEIRNWNGNSKAGKPTTLRNIRGVQRWLEGNLPLAVYQSGTARDWPRIAIDVGNECVRWLETQAKEESGLPKLCLVLDDADQLVPRDKTQPPQREISGLTALARQRDLGIILITQRVAEISREMLDQMETIFAFRSFEQSNLSFVQDRIPKMDRHMLTKLPVNEAVVKGKGSPMGNPIIVMIPPSPSPKVRDQDDLQRIGRWRPLQLPRTYTIQVYRLDGDWYMDDPQREIVMEALIKGMPEIIEHLVGKRTDRFVCTFSDQPVAGSSAILEKDIEADGGCWYVLKERPCAAGSARLWSLTLATFRR